MKPLDRRQPGKGGLDLIEEATQLLRTVSLRTLAVYYLGAIPFVLGLLYFWSDMSRSPFAREHLAGASLGMAVLFIWMKFWQAVFAGRLHSLIAAEPPSAWTPAHYWRVAVAQSTLQPWALVTVGFVLLGLHLFVPLGLMAGLMAIWVLSLFQNVTVMAAGRSGNVRDCLGKSWQQWLLWPRQNSILILVMGAFSSCVFLNWSMVCWLLPHLAKMLFGIESIFTRSGLSVLNTTFIAAMAGLTYLCVHPIIQACYALRCFYGEALESGEDLKAELRQIAMGAGNAAAGVLLLLMLGGGARVNASEAVPAGTQPAAGISQTTISAAELDRAVEQVIHQRKYTWHMPREEIAETESEQGAIGRFLESAAKLIRKWIRAVISWLDEWLRKMFSRTTPTGDSGSDWIVALEFLLYGLLGIVLALLAFLLYRLWRNRRQRSRTVPIVAIETLPDVNDEGVDAAQLPEEGWSKLGRELLERGEGRLALRAFYLASLAHLAERNLISIARFKSNRDYQSELRRRAHSLPELLSWFAGNVSLLEQVWYGMHEITREKIEEFAASVERMKAGL